MDTKVKAAEQHLWLIRADRERVANSEAATIPAALRAGLTPERIAQIVCVSVEHINQFQEGGT